MLSLILCNIHLHSSINFIIHHLSIFLVSTLIIDFHLVYIHGLLNNLLKLKSFKFKIFLHYTLFLHRLLNNFLLNNFDKKQLFIN